MHTYHDLLRHISTTGTYKDDRTETGTRSVFGAQMRFDLVTGFPLLATKFTPFKLIATELLWFLQGNPDLKYLHAHNNHIWDEWVKEDGTFGPIYGYQWRSWPIRNSYYNESGGRVLQSDGYIDQIQNVIDRLKSDPLSRRHIISAWNVADVESGEMALPPCHLLFQFYARPLTQPERTTVLGIPCQQTLAGAKDPHEVLDGLGVPRFGLSCQVYQRSCDMFLGVPFNIASYALLTHMIAHLTNMVPDYLIWTGGDCHIYSNHLEQVRVLLARDPYKYRLPQLEIKNSDSIETIDDFTLDHFEVIGYTHAPAIKAPISV